MKTLLYIFIAVCLLARGSLILLTKARYCKGLHKEIFAWSVLFALSFLLYGLNFNTSNLIIHYAEFAVDVIIGIASGFFTIRGYILALKDLQ